METPPKLPPIFQQFEQQEKQKAEKRNTIKLVIGYIIILVGIGSINKNGLTTPFCLIICGLLLIPQIITALERKLKFSFRILKYFLIVGLFVCAVSANKSKTHNKKTEQLSINKDSNSSITAKSNYNSVILKQETIAGGQINYWILVSNTDMSENNIKKTALELRDKLCSGDCTISLYDDEDAFIMDEKLEKKEMELGQMLSDGKISKEQDRALLKNYERKYYVKIADHLIGYLTHLDSDDFNYYPYRDSRYKELGGTSVIEGSTTDTLSSNTNENGNTNNSIYLDEDEQETKARYGLVNLEIYVKKNMNDPDSYEKVSSDYSYHGAYFIIQLKFRGTNAVGVKVINVIRAKIDLDGNLISILSDSD